ncbi:hypothetical protein DM02DRAFT_592558 [Periconia macrospinosa]|uniref:Zn(2)-C6 fungal-type domain-containing protein n=1 Tax=Periconia macrospinosa TaxID=97972 RepID=A0A2V1DUR5_9PLEO|nr:hypothetical protein DM02DRAFT_592558 [Periconia macrospinosa]
MPRVIPGQRKRAYRPKTRTGCQTCKVRRVKCDEGYPFCYKCVSTGRKCDGYGPNSYKFPKFEVAFVDALAQSPSVGFNGTDDERRSFYFFQQESAAQLSRFFGTDFWEIRLPQSALHEPSIRHAILALGSLHAGLYEKSDSALQIHAKRVADGFPLHNYGLAIKILIDSCSLKGQCAMDVCLICCILFACIETIQCRYGAAITHIQSGMRILSEVECNPDTGLHRHDTLLVSQISYVPINMLEKLFMRLDCQVFQMVGRQEVDFPAMFPALLQAEKALVSRWHITSHTTSELWDPTGGKHLAKPPSAWQAQSTSILARWSSAYEVYLDIRSDHLTVAKRKGMSTIRILRELGSTAAVLTKTTLDDEREWDAFCPMFRNIVSLALDIVKTDLQTTEGTPPNCINMAIVRLLFEVFCRCRDPITRRRIIWILQNCGRVEGRWNAFSTSKIAERVMSIEESGIENVMTCGDIHGSSRLSNVTPIFNPVENRAILTFDRPRHNPSKTGEKMEEIIIW